ncbi:MFS transporter [Actinocatenispora thailandica]|uniref:MFS transporter n=1 Tax=Actinocatenispora thailandica TaxID=227318 RepID=A0A7R7DRH9_9ACTN|nr:MFS transporter [Actinocatenispora thailandica]BCJ36508.1 MFS transporter [Actinocatenispora thailandica]
MSTGTTTAPPGAPARLPSRLVGSIAFGTLLQALNSSMIAVALVGIRTDFHAGADASWLVSALYLATAVGAPTMGRLADLIGPRRVFLAGLLLVAVASVAAPFAPTLGVLIGCRVLLGLGTAAQYPAGIAMVRMAAARGAPPGAGATGRAPRGVRAASALGILSVCSQTAVAFGPTLGGALVGGFGWQSIFLVNLPFVAIGAVCVGRWGPAGTPRATHRPAGAAALRRLDPAGLALFAATMTALMLFLLSLASAPRWWLLPVVLALGAALVGHELRAAEPFLDVRLLGRNRALTGTYLRTALTYVAFYAIFYGVPSWLEQGRGLSAAGAGLVVLPIAGLGVFMTLVATRLVRTRGPRLPLLFGSLGLLVGGVVLATVVHAATPVLALLAVSAVLGLPNGFNNMGNQTSMYAAAPADATGAASGLYRTSQYVGANLAAALIELLSAGVAPDTGLHRLGVAVAGIAAVLLLGSLRRRR